MMSRDLEISLDQLKNESISRIDSTTNERIVSGFSFDNKLFSMSVEAQINWSNIPLIPERSFPIPINTKHDELYMLTFEKRNTFYQSAMSHKMSLLVSSGNVKRAISSASTNEEILEIVSQYTNSSV